MSELSTTGITMNPQERLYHGMCLQLDENGCHETSSSSSSPDSMRSLCSLDSPDGITERKTATSEDDSGIQSPECRPDDNENSVSIYLDANEDGWDCNCEDKDNVSLILNNNQDLDYDVNEKQDAVRRDSSATEAPLVSSEDEDSVDEGEDSFLSMSSVDVGMNSQATSEEGQVWSSTRKVNDAYKDFQKPMEIQNQETRMTNLQRRSDVNLINSVGVHSEEGQTQSTTRRPSMDRSLDVQLETLLDMEDQTRSSSRSPSMDLMVDVQREALEESEVLPNKKDQTLRSSRRLSIDPLLDVQKEELHEPEKIYINDTQKKVNQECFPESLDPEENIQLQVSMEFPTEEGMVWSPIRKSSISPVSMIQQEGSKETVILTTEPTPPQLPSELFLKETVLELVTDDSSPIQNVVESPFGNGQNNQLSQDCLGQAHIGTITKLSLNISNRVELKRFPRPDLRNVKPKVMSRAASVPRGVNSDSRQLTSGMKRELLSIRGRVTNRTQQGDNLSKKNRSSSSQARVTDSGSKSQSAQPQMRTNSSLSINKEHLTSELSKIQEHKSFAKTQMRGERDNQKETVSQQETPTDGGQSVSSGLRAPVVAPRLPNRGYTPAGVRPTSASGVSKMRMIDSPAAQCGSASSWKAPQKPASSKLPIKTGSFSTSLSSSSLNSVANENNPNKGAAQVIKSEETSFRSSSSLQGKAAIINHAAGNCSKANITAKHSTAAQKKTAHTGQSKVTQNTLPRGGSAKPGRPLGTVCPSSKGSRGKRVLQKHAEEEDEKKNQIILQLRRLIAHGNRRLEALAVVIQHVFNEREEALKQKKEVSHQLKNLREELAQSVICCERLENEKSSVCAQLDATVVKLQQQHQVELTQLEETLREFYSAEWDKAYQIYQDEADRCRELMMQQVEEVRSKQELLRREQEMAHAQKIETLSQNYKTSLEELQRLHEENKQELNNKLKQLETELNERTGSLQIQNNVLHNRLREEEERRKLFEDKSQKDSQVLYLEQELASLKAVLEIKTEQLHQQDKKIMQMDKLIENNVKLEEFVKKLQQENEDYKERIDKHTAISRQLSTEQAMLQQNLQKESKANKRLSMENEELLWKLHNGLSPRSSACFSSPPVSPR